MMLLQSLGFSLGSTHGRSITSSGGRRVGMTGLAGEGVHVGGRRGRSATATEPLRPHGHRQPSLDISFLSPPPPLDVDDRSHNHHPLTTLPSC